MTKDEAIQIVKQEIRDYGFDAGQITDDFIECWADYYYDKHPGNLFEMFEGIMYEYDFA